MEYILIQCTRLDLSMIPMILLSLPLDVLSSLYGHTALPIGVPIQLFKFVSPPPLLT